MTDGKPKRARRAAEQMLVELKHRLRTFVDDPHDRIAGFAARRFVDLFEDLLKPRDVFFGLRLVLLERG
jgi:hypothetical protein